MTRIKSTSRKEPRIVSASLKEPKVSGEEVAKALGAKYIAARSVHFVQKNTGVYASLVKAARL